MDKENKEKYSFISGKVGNMTIDYNDYVNEKIEARVRAVSDFVAFLSNSFPLEDNRVILDNENLNKLKDLFLSNSKVEEE